VWDAEPVRMRLTCSGSWQSGGLAPPILDGGCPAEARTCISTGNVSRRPSGVGRSRGRCAPTARSTPGRCGGTSKSGSHQILIQHGTNEPEAGPNE